MKKFFALIASVAFSGLVFGQQLLPARQVSVTTNGWVHLAPTNQTVQGTFDVLENDVLSALYGWRDRTVTNFGLVNVNTYLTTNLFSTIVSQMLGMSGYDELPPDPTPAEELLYGSYTNFVNTLGRFAEMDLDYEGLPEGVSFEFPDLLEPLEFGLDTVADEVLLQAQRRVATEIFATNGTVEVSFDAGLDQFVRIPDHNTTFTFLPPARGVPATINLWIQNTGYTNVALSGAVQVNTNAFDISGETAVAYNRYHASPFASPNLWYEETVFPYGTDAIMPPPPASQNVAVSVAGLSNCTYQITTNTVAGASSETHTFYPTDAGSSASVSVTTSSNATFRVLVVGGGGGGGAPFGGGGGGGQAVLNEAVYLPAGTYSVTVGKGGAGGSSPGETKVKSDGTAGEGSSFHTVAAAGGSGGVGWTRWSGPGGAGGASGSVVGGVPSPGTLAGGGGAGPGVGGSGSGTGTVEYGGRGADGLADSPRGTPERFGAGGGGGQYANSRTTNYGGAGGGGNGGVNASGAQAGADATGWGAGGGGSCVGAAGAGFGGIVIISRPL